MYFELFARGIGLIYLIGFSSILYQLKWLNRICPTDKLLSRMREDFPKECYYRFPTFSWINASLQSLQIQCIIGILSSISIIYGPSTFTFLSFLSCYLLYVSLHISQSEFICYPWDNLIMETGFICCFLPNIPSLHNGFYFSEKPLASITLILWWIQSHFVFGMGKRKYYDHFSGNLKDSLTLWIQHLDYIQWYYLWQPIPTKLAYYFFKLPNYLHYLSLLFHFLAEIVFPLLFFTTYYIRVISSFLTGILMLSIIVFGNFGLFPPLGFLLCFPLYDSRTLTELILQLVYPQSFYEVILNYILFPIILVGGILNIKYCFWTNNAWLYNKDVIYASENSPIMNHVYNFYRMLHPFHIVNSYGVFPVETIKIRRVMVISCANDKGEWVEYKLHHLQTSEDSLPKSLFSYQPRIDHNFYYMAYDKFFDNYHIPYYTYGNRWFHRIIKLILLNDEVIKSLFRGIPDDFVPVELKISYRFLEYNYSSPSKWFNQIDSTTLKPKRVNLQFCDKVDEFPKNSSIESVWYHKRLKGYKVI